MPPEPGLAVKSTGCFSRGCRFNFWHPWCLTTICDSTSGGFNVPSSSLHGMNERLSDKYSLCRQNIYTYKIKMISVLGLNSSGQGFVASGFTRRTISFTPDLYQLSMGAYLPLIITLRRWRRGITTSRPAWPDMRPKEKNDRGCPWNTQGRFKEMLPAEQEEKEELCRV